MAPGARTHCAPRCGSLRLRGLNRRPSARLSLIVYLATHAGWLVADSVVTPPVDAYYEDHRFALTLCWMKESDANQSLVSNSLISGKIQGISRFQGDIRRSLGGETRLTIRLFPRIPWISEQGILIADQGIEIP